MPAGADRPQQRAGQRARPGAGLENRCAREDVAPVHDLRGVLRVDHRGAARHRQHVVGEQRPQRQVGGAGRGADHAAVGLADQVVVRQARRGGCGRSHPVRGRRCTCGPSRRSAGPGRPARTRGSPAAVRPRSGARGVRRPARSRRNRCASGGAPRRLAGVVDQQERAAPATGAGPLDDLRRARRRPARSPPGAQRSAAAAGRCLRGSRGEHAVRRRDVEQPARDPVGVGQHHLARPPATCSAAATGVSAGSWHDRADERAEWRQAPAGQPAGRASALLRRRPTATNSAIATAIPAGSRPARTGVDQQHGRPADERHRHHVAADDRRPWCRRGGCRTPSTRLRAAPGRRPAAARAAG